VYSGTVTAEQYQKQANAIDQMNGRDLDRLVYSEVEGRQVLTEQELLDGARAVWRSQPSCIYLRIDGLPCAGDSRTEEVVQDFGHSSSDCRVAMTLLSRHCKDARIGFARHPGELRVWVSVDSIVGWADGDAIEQALPLAICRALVKWKRSKQ